MFHRNVSEYFGTNLSDLLDFSLGFAKQLRGFEHIKGVVVDPRPFDMERDLMTPTMKKKRAQMLKYYQVII